MTVKYLSYINVVVIGHVYKSETFKTIYLSTDYPIITRGPNRDYLCINCVLLLALILSLYYPQADQQLIPQLIQTHVVSERNNRALSSLMRPSVPQSSSILRQACSTVVWSRPPKASPISGRLCSVNSFESAIAICRGRAMVRVRRLESSSATRIL